MTNRADIKRSAVALVTASILSAFVVAMHPAVARAADNEITLTGCLVRAEGDGGYLLTNTPQDPAWINPSDTRVSPSAVGTVGGFSTIFYWLEGSGDLKDHIGQRVEVKGDVKGDFKEGQIELDRKDNWTDVSIKADGRTMKAKVPNMSAVSPEGRDKDTKSQILVRKVDVEKVKMVAASCER